MKKILLASLGLLMSLIMTAAELNIYATGLKVSVESNVAQLTYTLNAPATALELQLLNADGTVNTVLPLTDASYLTKGQHQIQVPLTGVTPGTYAWAMKAAAAPTTEVGLASNSETKFIFYSPRGVEVDNNPESPHFGNIYVVNSYKGASDGMTTTSQNQPEGVFFYDAALNLKNQNNQSFKGGVTWNAAGWGPYNMAIDAEGKVFVCDSKEATTGIWMMDPANPEANFTEVLDVTQRGTTFTLITSMAVANSGDQRVLFAIDNTKSVVKFPIGAAATPYAAAPDTVIASLSEMKILNGRNHLVSDGNYGWWINQWRGQVDTYPYLIHVNKAGVVDFEMSSASNSDIAPANHNRGGFAINPARNMIALSGNKTINLFDVTYDAETGAPTLTKSAVTLPTIGNNIDGVAFDRVGNIYFASASVEWFYAFALPKADNSFVTPAPKASTITVTDEKPVFYDELISFTEAKEAGEWSNGAILPDAQAAFQILLTDTKKKFAIDANTTKFNTGKGIASYDFRLKTGGKSSAAENFMTLTFPADGYLTMCVRSGKNSDNTRVINVIQGEDTLYTKAPDEAELVYTNIDGNKTAVYPMAVVAVKKGTARLDYPINGVNFYAIGFCTTEPTINPVKAWVSVESVALDKHEITALEEGDTQKLIATITPATADKQTCQWTVKDEAIATVADGVVKAVAPGETWVYVTTDDEKKIDSCRVEVIAKKYWYPNIYAYALAMRPADNIDPNHYLVEYTLNAPATEVNLLLLNTAANCICYDTIALTGKALGYNYEDVQVNLPAGKYEWFIEAKAELASDDEAVQANVYDLTAFTTPRGLVVNSNPMSPYFGNIYVTESGGTVAEAGGFKVYNALLQTNDQLYTGAWSASKASPMRISIGQDDDMLYISDWSDNAPNIHIVDPANLTQETLVFGGTYDASGVATNEAGDTIHGSLSSCYVTGKGADRKLYTFDEDMKTGYYPMGMFRYDIGELTSTWLSKPSAVVYNNADRFEQNGNSVIIPDNYGGWWISQDRSVDNQSIPALIHIDATGAVDFNSSGMVGGRTRGALAFNADQSQFVGAANNRLLVYDVTYDANHKPVMIEPSYQISTTFGSEGSQSCYSIGIDYAGNIYATGDGKPLSVWANVKEENKAVTPGKGIIEIIATGLIEQPAADNDGIRKVMIDGQVYIIRNGKMYNMIGATL